MNKEKEALASNLLMSIKEYGKWCEWFGHTIKIDAVRANQIEQQINDSWERIEKLVKEINYVC